MPSLEPLLIKMMFTNIAGELATMKTTFKTFELRVPKVEEAQTNCKTCQVGQMESPYIEENPSNLTP